MLASRGVGALDVPNRPLLFVLQSEGSKVDGMYCNYCREANRANVSG
jgi:hypothetical protein